MDPRVLGCHIGDPESEEEWPDSAGARSQYVPSAQVKMPGRLRMKQKWMKMYGLHP